MIELCSYLDFRYSVLNPEKHFQSLKDSNFDVATIACSEHFAECVTEIDGKQYHLYAPISIDAIHYARRANEALLSSSITEYKILFGEMLIRSYFTDSCSIVLEEFPEGTLLSEALYTHSRKSLHQGLQDLKKRMSREGVCHTNLTPENIIVGDDHRWHPIRWYYAQRGKRKDFKALKHLAALIDELAFSSNFEPNYSILNSPLSPYAIGRNAPICERRRRTIKPQGIGFSDDRGDMVIEGIYAAATDFTEGRAIVTLKGGKKGVINRAGAYVIPPHYDDIDFDIETGESEASLDGVVTIFDYYGNEVK